MGKHAFINADGVLTSWGYQESNNDDTKIEVDDTFALPTKEWKYENGNWVEWNEPENPIIALSQTDSGMTRAVEDLIALLITKGTIELSELPTELQNKINERKVLRNKLS